MGKIFVAIGNKWICSKCKKPVKEEKFSMIGGTLLYKNGNRCQNCGCAEITFVPNKKALKDGAGKMRKLTKEEEKEFAEAVERYGKKPFPEMGKGGFIPVHPIKK